MSNDKVFVDGLIVKRHENAPDYVLCNLSIKVEELIPFLQQHASNGWVNVQCKQGKSGKLYAELDTWKPTHGDTARQEAPKVRQQLEQPAGGGDFDEDIPFAPYMRGMEYMA